MKKDLFLFVLLIGAMAAAVAGSEWLAHCRHDDTCSLRLGLPGISGEPVRETAAHS